MSDAEFGLVTEEPSIAYQVWMKIKKDPRVAANLSVERLSELEEFRHLEKNAISAAVTDLRERGVLSKIDSNGRSFIYGPGPAFHQPQKFGKRVVGGKRDRKPGYSQARGAKPGFQLSPQAGFDLGANYARDETRERQLVIARALPLSVIEQVLTEKRAAAVAAREHSPTKE